MPQFRSYVAAAHRRANHDQADRILAASLGALGARSKKGHAVMKSAVRALRVGTLTPQELTDGG